MIPRYRSGYGFSDIVMAWRNMQQGREELSLQLKQFFGVRHAILFSSARDAITCLFRVICDRGAAVLPAYNCIAVPEAVVRSGCRPVFADIASDSVNMTRDTLEASLADDTRAVVLTHQFGIPPAIEPIIELCRQKGLFVVEDAAAALGAQYKGRLIGTFGDAAVISFHFTKVIGAGRCGALLVNDNEIAGKVASLQTSDSGMSGNMVDFARAMGWWMATQPRSYTMLRKIRRLVRKDPLHEIVIPKIPGTVGQFPICSNFVAKLARIQMDRIDGNLAARRDFARIYADELGSCRGIKLIANPEGAEPAWLQYPIFTERKEYCYRYLLEKGIDLSWTFRYSCGESYGIRTVPNADKAAREILGLPTFCGMESHDAHKVCDLVRHSLKY